MADDSQDNEPLVGFQITDYDGKVHNVEIPIHEVLLKHPAQVEKLVLKCIEIIAHGQMLKVSP